MKKIHYLFLILVSAIISCAAPVAEPTPTIEATAVSQALPTEAPPTEIVPTDTPTALPTDTPEPTATPTITPTPLPTFTPTPEPTATPDVPRFSTRGNFVFYRDEPVVINDNLGPSGRQFTDPGGVVFHEGQYHMFHNAFTGWPAKVDVMYSVSDDGINWTLAQEEPVFEGEDLTFVGVAALASSVVVRDDGTWMMYFYSWDDFTWPVSETKIGVATADSPFGPWTAFARPILRPGASGEWDELGVRTPSVQKVDDGYVMFYSGHTENTAHIGQAFSEDGLSWTKFDDPSTEEAPFQNSDPIFAGSGVGWDSRHVYQPRLQITADGWVMLYTHAGSVGGSSLSQNHGLAFSQNGTDWVRSETAVFQPSEVNSRGQNIWFTELTYANDIYTIFIELGVGNETEIYAVTFDSGIFP
ncbi:MAG: hypothetical protein AAF490_12725 [Chloroflexota bacterium]